MKKDIHLAHSPDSDDAFMFYALATRKIDTGDLNYVHLLSDMETLNRRALAGEYEVSTVSCHAYAYIAEQYALMSCGSTMGRNYGPIIVSARPMQARALSDKVVAIPGTLTSAFLALQLYDPNVKYEVVAFDRILEEVQKGKYEAGLLIHEGQLTYREQGMHKVLDLGEWWQERTGLPLPLGCNVIKRDLGADIIERVAQDIRKSIEYGLDHREEAMSYAMQFSRGLDSHMLARFIGMYVNDLTLDCGLDGREAVRRILEEGHQKGIIPNAVALEFV